MRRVAGLSKFIGKRAASSSGDDKIADNILTLKDTVATIAASSNGHQLIVVCVDTILGTGKEKLTCCALTEESITLSGKPLELTTAVGDEGELKFKWKIGEVNKNKAVKFNLQACSIISPKQVDDDFIFCYNDLQLIFEALQRNISNELPKSDVYIAATNGDRVLFKSKKITEKNAGETKCEVCHKAVKLKLMRNHVGKHYLKKEVSTYCCGYCGHDSCGCSLELVKTTHNITVPNSNCPHFVKFSLKASQKLNAKNQCSNRPVKCQLCETVYWSYAMPEHYTDIHPDRI